MLQSADAYVTGSLPPRPPPQVPPSERTSLFAWYNLLGHVSTASGSLAAGGCGAGWVLVLCVTGP